MRRYSDGQLIEALRASHSWRGVLRALGLSATSAAAMRSVRMHADRLGLDYSHFTGQRRWTDQQLVAAIASAASWGQVTEALGLAGGSSTTTVRGHAVRLGIDSAHLARQPNAYKLRRTTVKQGTSWTVWISNTGKERTTYDPDEIDHFFVIDGDFDYYLIPVAAVGGLTAIQLSAYRGYRLPRAIDT